MATEGEVDLKARIDELERRVALGDKRFDDVKWFFGSISLVLSVLAVIAGYSFNADRGRLDAALREFKEETAKLDAAPKLEVFGVNRERLDGQEVSVRVEQAVDGRRTILLNFILENTGPGRTGPLWVKAYTPFPVKDGTVSTDERPTFAHQVIFSPAQVDGNELPGGLSDLRWLRLEVDQLSPGRYPILMKHYYGKGKVATARFTLLVESSSR